MPTRRQPTARPAEDPEREERIELEIVVDCYNDSERASGWFCYLQDRLACPFEAECIEPTPASPLLPGERVTVLELLDPDETEGAFFASIQWQGREMAIPLSRLRALNASPETTEALADWHYWVSRGYEF